jgi:hypothetical protein
MGHIMTTARSSKRQAQPRIDHFGRLLEEDCSNYAYPIKHKLKDCGMMKSFIISRFLTRGMEVEEDLGGSDTMPFPGEEAVMTVYDGRPSPGSRRVTNMSPGTLTHYGWGSRSIGV